MKRFIIILLLLIISLTGCISAEERYVSNNVSFIEQESSYDFVDNSDYNENYLKIDLKEINETDAYKNHIVHIKTFAPSTNYKLSIESININKKQLGIPGRKPFIKNLGSKIIINARVIKTSNIGGSAITTLKKSIIIENTEISNLKRVRLNINNTITGNSTVYVRK